MLPNTWRRETLPFPECRGTGVYLLGSFARPRSRLRMPVCVAERLQLVRPPSRPLPPRAPYCAVSVAVAVASAAPSSTTLAGDPVALKHVSRALPVFRASISSWGSAASRAASRSPSRPSTGSPPCRRLRRCRRRRPRRRAARGARRGAKTKAGTSWSPWRHAAPFIHDDEDSDVPPLCDDRVADRSRSTADDEARRQVARPRRSRPRRSQAFRLRPSCAVLPPAGSSAPPDLLLLPLPPAWPDPV